MVKSTIFIVAFLTAGRLRGQDACEAKLPPSLRAEFKQAFPGHRQIVTSDYEPSELAAESKYHRGSRCIAVEPGDFNGDRRRDFVFLALSSTKSVVALVALRLKAGWQIRELLDLGFDQPGCCYANVLAPGTYKNFYGTAPDPQSLPAPDERLTFTSKTQALVVGAIESTGVAFFFSEGRWLHVRVSD